MKKNTILVWDIENFHFKKMKRYFKKVKLKEIEKEIKKLLINKNIEKHFVRNNKYLPLKESEENFLINQDWILHKVNPGFNSADNKIKDILESNINNYDYFIIITNDHGFSNIISKISINNKIILISEKNRNTKLINSCFSNEDLVSSNLLLLTV